jgi:hypothetical protein
MLLEEYHIADWSIEEDPESRRREDRVDLRPQRESEEDMMQMTG